MSDVLDNWAELPGADLIRRGLEDLGNGIESIPSLLVRVGGPRLRDLGLEVPWLEGRLPEHSLYSLLEREDEDTAHGRYNALIRRLVSFERAAECVARQTPEK